MAKTPGKRVKVTGGPSAAPVSPSATPVNLHAKLLADIRGEFAKDKDAKARLVDPGEHYLPTDIRTVSPTGIDVLDRYVLGYGGFGGGRIYEVLADKGHAKTALLLGTIGATQRAGGIAGLIEIEKTLTSDRLRCHGVDRERMLLTECNTLEDGLLDIERMFQKIPKRGHGIPIVVGIDSLAATTTEKELADGIVSKKADARKKAQKVAHAVRQLTGLCYEHEVALVVINQTRTQTKQTASGFSYEVTYTPGGKQLFFACSARLQLFRGKADKDGSEHRGMNVTVTSVHSKVAVPNRSVRLYLDYAEGWSNERATFAFAKECGLVDGGARFTSKLAAEAREKLVELKWTPPKGTVRVKESDREKESGTVIDDAVVDPSVDVQFPKM